MSLHQRNAIARRVLLCSQVKFVSVTKLNLVELGNLTMKVLFLGSIFVGLFLTLSLACGWGSSNQGRSKLCYDVCAKPYGNGLKLVGPSRSPRLLCYSLCSPSNINVRGPMNLHKYGRILVKITVAFLVFLLNFNGFFFNFQGSETLEYLSEQIDYEMQKDDTFKQVFEANDFLRSQSSLKCMERHFCQKADKQKRLGDDSFGHVFG